MSAEHPIVFLAFANQLDDHLTTLKDESRDVFKALQPLERANQIAIHREESSEFDELYDALLAYDDRVVIFHYAGHADGVSLELEGGSGGAEGIAGLLGQQSSLKLVFLNGCATLDHVKLLHAAGVPAVIATSVKINDNRASQFSIAFYAALAEGRSIFEAFDSASSYIEGKFGVSDSSSISISRRPKHKFKVEEDEPDPEVFEWALYTQEHATHDLEQWRLPEAREDWRVELSDFQGKLKSLDGEPLVLEHHSRRRTLPIVHCQRCDTETANPEDNNVACPVCGFSELEAGSALSNVPDLYVPFQIEEPDALAIFEKTFGGEGFSEPRLKKVLLPYWHFDVETRTALEAERGSADLSSSDSPTLKWEKIEDEFDLSTPGFLVPGGQAPPAHTGNNADWQWEVGEAKSVSDLDLPDALVPAVEDLPTAFESFTEDLSIRVEQEVRERVGGLEQKNISTDTRYKHLAAKSLLLPHWYASANTPEGEICLLINGQTGAVRYPQIPGMNAGLSESQKTMQKSASDARAGHEKSSALVSVFSGVGIGIMVGLLMGLAAPAGDGAKTVVSVFIGAVGVGLAALLGLNDRYFSNPKGLRIGSFGLAVAIAGLSGIYVRDHGLMSPSLKERADEVRDVFPQFKEDDEKVFSVLKAMDPEGGEGISPRSYMFSGVSADQSVCQKLTLLQEDSTTIKGALNMFDRSDPDRQLGWKSLADKVVKQLPKEKVVPFLLLSRDALCGNPPFDSRVTLTGPQCESENPGTQDWREIFASTASSVTLLKLIEEMIDENDQNEALEILGPVLCPVD